MRKIIYFIILLEFIMSIFITSFIIKINSELETIKSQNDSLKQEIVLLNNYLYD